MSKTIEQLADEYSHPFWGKEHTKESFLAGAAAQREQDRAELERVREALEKMAQTDVTDEVGIVWLTNWRNDTKAAARSSLSILTALLGRGKG